MYKLTNVSFQVEDKVILEPLTIEIQEGKVTTLLGHNGCGKTTLMKLLSQQIQAKQGSILLDGQPINEYKSRELALKLAYLPQHPPLTEGVTIRELVLFGRYPWKGAFGRYTKKDYGIVDQAIEQVDLQKLQHRFVSTLSGGERQRAWVAMLLAQQSKAILLDEPTSSLDISHQYELIQLIRDLNQEMKLTVIMVLHDINLAARFSDEFIALHSGKLIAQDSPEKMMKEDTLKQIYGMDLALFKHPNSGQPITYIP